MSSKNNTKQCMNPLFLSWLEGWRDEAKERGTNAQWSYEKAITSVRKYPLPLRSGKDAKILENIGDGIAKKLDKALEEFIKNGGDISAMHALPIPAVAMSTQINKKRPNVNKKPNQQATVSTSDSQLDGVEPVAKKKKKEYLPKQRSGPYALLLTLYRESQQLSYKGYMLKEELQHKAEPLIGKSFTTSEAGNHYTPWSSMSTLTAKQLVNRYSNPSKYAITDEGSRLGRILSETEKANPSFKIPEVTAFSLDRPRDNSNERTAFSSMTSTMTSTAVFSPQGSDIPVSNTSVIGFPSTSTTSHAVGGDSAQDFCYWYVEETGKVSTTKDDALVTVEGNHVWFLIKCQEASLRRYKPLYKLDTTRPRRGQFVFAFIADQDAKDVATPPKVNPEYPKAPVSRLPSTAVDKNIRPVQPATSTATTARIPEKQRVAPAESTTPLYCMKPGTFEIVLCVDQMEVVGGSKTHAKRLMLDQLKGMSVKMDVRKLHLGDFLWIARERTNYGGTRREVVLDFIVERKRMDDLAGSITDGRFKEQKFRLKACGLKHVIYLVENYGSMQHMVIPESTLKQAIVNSQVVDGLFIRKTEGTHDSAAYLTRMTKLLQHFYQNKTIWAYPADHIRNLKQDLDFREIIRNGTQKLMTFNEFYQSTTKNKMLTVKEMFAKQLMQLKGISADKAAAIVETYTTPKSLIQAFERCSTDDEKESLLSDLTFGKGQRKVGPMLAKQVRLLYSSRTPLA